jgi:hypothetical protein
MRSKYIVLAVALSVGAVSIAWSAEEPTKPADAPAAQPSPAAQPGPAAQPVPAAQRAPAASDTSTEAETQEKNILARGYKKETHKGQTVFCRKEIPLGSRFETKHCGTAQEMALQEQQARDLMNGNRTSGGSR